MAKWCLCCCFFFFFSFFAEKKVLLFPFGPRLERGLQSVKKLPSKCREGLQAALMLRELLKGHWIPEAPSHAWGRAFQKDVRPTQPRDQLACRGASGGHPSSWWVSSHLEVVLPEVTDVGIYAGRTQSMQTQKGLIQILLLESGSFHSILGFTPLILRCFCTSRKWPTSSRTTSSWSK